MQLHRLLRPPLPPGYRQARPGATGVRNTATLRSMGLDASDSGRGAGTGQYLQDGEVAAGLVPETASWRRASSETLRDLAAVFRPASNSISVCARIVRFSNSAISLI